MSIADQITELTTIRGDIRTALVGKGVSASDHNFADFASDISSISGGGGGNEYEATLLGQADPSYYLTVDGDYWRNTTAPTFSTFVYELGTPIPAGEYRYAAILKKPQISNRGRCGVFTTNPLEASGAAGSPVKVLDGDVITTGINDNTSTTLGASSGNNTASGTFRYAAITVANNSTNTPAPELFILVIGN